MPSASGEPWKPAAPTAIARSSSQMMPVTHGSSSGCSSSCVARRANVDRNASVTKTGVSGTGESRLAPARSPAAIAAWVGWETWTMRTLMPAILAGTRRRPWPGLAQLLLGLGRQPVARRRCRGCGRSRAGGSGPAARRPRTHRRPSTPEPSTRAKSGRAQSTNAPGNDRQPSSASSSLRSLPSGRVDHRVAHHADGVVPGVVGAVEDEDPQVHPDLARRQADAVGGVHRRHHVGDQGAQVVVVRRHVGLRSVHDRGAPARHRPDRAALGQRPVRRLHHVGAHAGNPSEGSARGRPHGPPARVSGDTRTDPATNCNSELQLPHVRPQQAADRRPESPPATAATRSATRWPP